MQRGSFPISDPDVIKDRKIVGKNLLALLKKVVFVETTDEVEGKEGYDKVYSYFVPVILENGNRYTVKIITLHKKNNPKFISDVWSFDLYQNLGETSSLTNTAFTAGQHAGESPKISITKMLRGLKGKDQRYYLSHFDEKGRFIKESDSGQTLYQSAKSNLPETIEIDGEEKSTRNSEGGLIADTEEGIRNFYKWFGDSKVVDNDGRPLVMYHGTPNKGFEEFNTPSHFSPDKKYA